jgi:hypothetical protein
MKAIKYLLKFTRYIALPLLIVFSSCKKNSSPGPSGTGSSRTFTTTVSVFAGNGNINDVVGQGEAASFFYPTSIAMDASGNLFVGEAGGGIRTVSSTGLVANFPVTFLPGFDPLTGGAPNLVQGLFLAVDPFLKVLLVSDPIYNYISGTSMGVPFSVVPAIQGDFEPPAHSRAANPDPSYPYIFQYAYPIGIYSTNNGTIYVSNNQDNFIQQFIIADTINYPGEGTDTGYAPTVNTTGLASGGLINSPNGLCADANNNVYVANGGGNNILKITPAGVVSVFAGSASGISGSADGTGTAASFDYPTNVVIDGQGNLYVADTENQRIRIITPAGVVSTVAYQFSFVSGLAVNSSGTNLFAADMNGCKIYQIAIQ